MTKPRTDKLPSRVLKDAAKLIETYGWAQGRYETDDGCLCALGAIRMASNPGSKSRADAMSMLAVHIGSPDVSGWNDHPDQTKAKVTATLRETANKLEIRSR